MGEVCRENIFHLQGGNRVTDPEETDVSHHLTLCLTLPLMMRPECWTRYDMSKDDVRHILSAYPDQILYQMALYLNIRVPISALKMDYAQHRHISYYTRFKVVDHIVEAMGTQESHDFGPGDRLVKACTTHQPVLPGVEVALVTLEAALEDTPDTWDPLGLHYFKRSYTHKDVTLVPVEHDGDKVCMHRVVPEEEYTDFGDSMTARAPRCLVRGQRHAVTEEACWFVAASS